MSAAVGSRARTAGAGPSRTAPAEASSPTDKPAAGGATEGLAAFLVSVRELLAAAGADRPKAAGDRAVTLTVPPHSTLAVLRERFSLSAFEIGVVGLALAVELAPELGRGFAALDHDGAAPSRPYPTFARALTLLDGGHWDALAPGGTLRHRRLITLGDGEVLTERPVRLPERVLHALMGVHELDVRVARRVRRLGAPPTLPPSHERAAHALAATLRTRPGQAVLLAAELATDAPPVVARAGERSGLQVLAIDGVLLPGDAGERDELLQLWHREAFLSGLLLAVELDGCTEPGAERVALDFALRAETPVVITGRSALGPADRPIPRIDIPAATFDERLILWRDALGGLPQPSAAHLTALAAHFRGDVGLIRDAADKLRLLQGEEPEGQDTIAPGVFLWRACRMQARARMGALAQRASSDVRLDDVVLPDSQRRLLGAILAQVRHKATVEHTWGFHGGEARGNGVAAMFVGPSGTGKTMAAEALATALDLDVYRVDLSAVVSKYIGETEQNLRRVFDAAEAAGAVLLFDEADALFGKRTEVKDSHDRHANIEVSYLLQRMEAYGGLAILTTNLRKNIDEAFLRRIPFVVDFPFPDAEHRERIWRRIFPPTAPLQDVSCLRLAKLSLAGGNIRGVARNAAFLAAAAGEPITMRALLEATRIEYAKLGRSLPSEEIRGWV